MSGDANSRDNKTATLDALTAVLQDSEQRKDFDLDWLNAVAGTLQRQRGILVGVMAVSFVPTAYLALFLLGKASELQAFGFRIDEPRSAFEIALLATCLLGVYGARVAIIVAQAEQIMTAWLKATFPDVRWQLYAFAFDPPIVSPPPFIDPPNLEPSSEANWWKRSAFGSFYVVAFAVGFAAFATQFSAIGWAIWEIAGPHCTVFLSNSRVCPEQKPSLIIVGFCALISGLNFFAYIPYAVKRRFKVPNPPCAACAAVTPPLA